MPDIDPICELIDDAVDKHQALEAMPDVITWHGSGDAMEEVNGERGGIGFAHSGDQARERLALPVLPRTFRARDNHGRIPYERLTGDEREALHEWCGLHGIDHTRVPIDTRIERVGDEWHIDVFDLRNGSPYLRSEAEGMAIITLRRPFKAELPWRTQ